MEVQYQVGNATFYLFVVGPLSCQWSLWSTWTNNVYYEKVAVINILAQTSSYGRCGDIFTRCEKLEEKSDPPAPAPSGEEISLLCEKCDLEGDSCLSCMMLCLLIVLFLFSFFLMNNINLPRNCRLPFGKKNKNKNLTHLYHIYVN